MAQRITDLRGGEGGYAALDDRMLVLDFQAGHPEAFVEIHKRYGALARRVVTRYLPIQQDADEAFQETMIRVFQGLYRFNGRYALQPWIARIATNVSLDVLRSRARRPTEDGHGLDEHQEVPDPGETPDEAVERLVQRDLVLSVLTGMPEAHRQALVLREIEGRSHREIAKELDISPAQAKALIHRAKGTFRRRWLETVAERGGLAGFALVPLVWALHVVDAVRRFGEKAAQAIGTAEVVTNAAASSATVAPAATSAGERLVAAAAVTVLVAGSVTVGAAISHRHPDKQVRDAASPVVRMTPPPAPVVAPPPIGTSQDDATVKGDRGSHDVVVVPTPTPTVSPSPEVSPSEEPSTEPSASPAGEPSAEPTPSDEPSAGPSPSDVPPPIPPAPAWDFTFMALKALGGSCDCDTTPTLETSHFEGDLGSDVSFTQSMKGVVVDENGKPAWQFYLEHAGTAGPLGGGLTASFVLSSNGEPSFYDGHASLLNTEVAADGSYVYRFSGAYQLRPGRDIVRGVPQQGTLVVTIGVWPDGTIYYGSVVLMESS